MQKFNRTRARASFTLLEILIVVAIIAILISISAGVYFRVYGVATTASARNDITQLSSALGKFSATYHRGYPPSAIKLAYLLNTTNYPNMNTTGTLDYDSVQFLTSVFTNIGPTWETTGIDWSNGTGLSTTGSVILEGDQCLVFFLGTNFTTNPFNPMPYAQGAYQPNGPCMQFKTNRLVNFAHNGDPTGIFPSFQDAYQHTSPPAVYAYFSANNINNGYNRYGGTDCPTLGVWPYAGAGLTPQYLNATTFQIICAGADGIFGPGTNLTATSPMYWTSGTAGQVNGLPPGYDDLSNFSPKLLGVPN
jgi:prepilin-type N-terminal cleavage/methylation domain-containing protein